MKIVIENNEDEMMMGELKRHLKDDILWLMESYNIDISRIPNEDDIHDLIMSLSVICNQYKQVHIEVEKYRNNNKCKCECGCDCIRF